MTKQAPLHPLLMKELEDALYVEFGLMDLDGIGAEEIARCSTKVVTAKLRAWGLLDP